MAPRRSTTAGRAATGPSDCVPQTNRGRQLRTSGHRSPRRWRIQHADCLKALPKLPANSIDAVITDPPYGLEFMGKEWDSFRSDDPTRSRHRGERACSQGRANGAGDGNHPANGKITVAYGGGVHPETSRCTGCGKRDQFRKKHTCDPSTRWVREPIDLFAAPPTMLAFENWCREWALAAIRVLKPGGHLLAFGGTRTHHRLATALEDAGFEIRDCLCWLYGQGFPKSMNVATAIDKAEGHPPRGRAIPVASTHLPGDRYAEEKLTANPVEPYRARSQAAAAWQGWGTALKPAWEPIILARKPPDGTIADNVGRHGTAALNIDGCRIAFQSDEDEHESKTKNRHADFDSRTRKNRIYGRDERARGNYNATGRWPANVTLSHSESCRQIGRTHIRSNGHHPPTRGAGGIGTAGHKGQKGLAGRSRTGEPVGCWECSPDCTVRMLDEQTGVVGASRFFYCAKASRTERNAGLDSFHAATTDDGRQQPIDNLHQRGKTPRQNIHPTVKPIALMRYLVRLVTPPGGVVLDPFAGSGTTGAAVVLEGAHFLGIEHDPTYVPIARARIKHWAKSTQRPRQ